MKLRIDANYLEIGGRFKEIAVATSAVQMFLVVDLNNTKKNSKFRSISK